jgi:hypothetical protein
MKFTRITRTVAALVVAVLSFTVGAVAQTAPTQTTLSAAITDSSSTSMIVASATGFTAQGNGSTFVEALIDKELVGVRTVSGTVIGITRGLHGVATPHASGAVVTVGNPAAFQADDRSSTGKPTAGSCTATNEVYLPVYNYTNGRRWNCIGGLWMIDNGYAFLGPAACNSSVSGNSTGTNGYTTLGTAPSIPVVQAQTSATGTNTHYYVCNLNALTAGLPTGSGRTLSLIDVVAFYGIQTTAVGTQVATLASGTMNSKTVFQSIAYPTAAASETATGLAEVARADSGSLVITPAVASFNVGTTTAGEFFSAKFAPASAFQMATDLKQYLFTFSLLNTATSATVTNLAGILVHYAYIPD